MKRWDMSQQRLAEAPEVDAFLEELIAVCRKHQLWLGHEDTEGAFVVINIGSPEMETWLLSAADARLKL